MSENKKITLEELNKAVEDVYMPIADVNWNGLDLTVKRVISLKEIGEFVKYVVSVCFADDTKEYLPEVRDIAIKTFILEHYTNIELPDDINQKVKIIYETDIMHTILSIIDPNQLNEIVRAIDVKIDYLVQQKADSLEKKIEDMYDSLEGLYNTIKNVFSGITEDSMKELVNAISEHGLDEEKLMAAYFARKDGNDKDK